MAETLLTSVVFEEIAEGVTSFRMDGEKHAEAIVNAVIDGFERRTRADHGVSIEDALRRRIGVPVTLIQQGENMMGARLVVAREGKLFETPRGLAILPKGKRTKGLRVDPEKVLDVIDGHNLMEAQERVAFARSAYPELKPLTQERLLELPKNRQGTGCTLAVFGSHPLFGSSDALWLIGEYWPEDDIVELCVLLLRPEHGTSESGSIFGRQLLSMPVGEVVGFVPVSFDTALRLADLDDHETALDAALHGSKRVAT